MQKSFAIGMGALLGAVFCFQPANASYLFPDVNSHSASRHFGEVRTHAARTDQARGDVRLHGGSLGECAQAARQGGPCGCVAARYFGLPRLLKVGNATVNLWLADQWLVAFERTSAAPGTAAVWPHRHVAAVIDTASDRVLVVDSWATHWVSKRGLQFVIPGAPRRSRWASN
jgi:hypothetical protein